MKFVCSGRSLVEEKMETLVYDEANFLTATGGNLGLFLGFSCFSLLAGILETLRHFRWQRFPVKKL
jgi:hypothetical protein